MEHYHEIARDLRGPSSDLRAAIPEVWGAFGEMHAAAMADGALTSATKELIALAVSVVKHCDGCIVSHARSAAKLGVTEQEVVETLGVALMMDGGPATVWGPRALAAFREFAGPT